MSQTTETAADIARAMNGRKSGKGWMVRCVAHEDRNPSMSLTSGDDGRLLVHCHAGCSQDAVLDALKSQGLWPESTRQSTPKREHRAIVTAIYDYVDESGALLYQVCRTNRKGFFQRCPDGCGGWLNRGPKDENRVLFHLPEVIEAPIVFLVEGEKDCETLRQHGFVATCEAGGANAKWLPQFTAALAGREIILIPDNDAPGRQRGARIARALLGQSAKLTVLELNDAKDISEWFERGHSEVELVACLEVTYAG